MIDLIEWYPWIGERYLSKQGLLICGESHYASDEVSNEREDFTQQVIRRQFGTRGSPGGFHSNIQAMVAADPSCNPEAFWQSVAFANIIPGFVPHDCNKSPSVEQMEATPARFLRLLRDLRPAHILILGKRSWEMTPAGRTVQVLNRKGNKAGFGELQEYCGAPIFDDLHCALVFQTLHPSLPGFSPASWRSMVQSFLLHPKCH